MAYGLWACISYLIVHSDTMLIERIKADGATKCRITIRSIIYCVASKMQGYAGAPRIQTQGTGAGLKL